MYLGLYIKGYGCTDRIFMPLSELCKWLWHLHKCKPQSLSEEQLNVAIQVADINTV
jgi:hypothetical protein